MVLASLATLPSFWITDTNLLAASRFVLGVFAGGVLPSLRAALAESANEDPEARSNVGALYGFSQSALSGGVALGGGTSALEAASLGLPYIHLASAAILFVGALFWLLQGRIFDSGSLRLRPT
jgi:MFS family permease